MKPHGIEVIHELPGVGRNLQDHVDCVIAYTLHGAAARGRDARCAFGPERRIVAGGVHPSKKYALMGGSTTKTSRNGASEEEGPSPM